MDLIRLFPANKAAAPSRLKVNLVANHEVRRLVDLPVGQTSPRSADFGTVSPLEAGVREGQGYAFSAPAAVQIRPAGLR